MGKAKRLKEEKVAEPKTEIDFGFIIIKTEGAYRVTPLKDEDGEPLFENLRGEDVYQACDAICRSIQVEQTAQAITNGMMQVAQQAQAAAEGKTEGGIVLPK